MAFTMFMLYLFILAVLHGANTQDRCVPDPVEGIQLDEDGRLHWKEVTNCELTGYVIFMSLKGQVVTHLFEVEDAYVHVTNLPACADYRFTIRAISTDLLMGDPTIHDTKLPLFPDANVTVSAMRATPKPNSGLLLEWDIEEKWVYCVEYYRVVRWDRLSEPVDTYVLNATILVEELAPCAVYEFTVVPIYNNDLEGGVGVVAFTTPHEVSPLPTLESVRPGPTFLDMTLDLPPYATNRCPISSVIVDGSPYVNLTIPIDDSPTRPPVHVHVESLRPDSMYRFRVTVINNAGTSAPFPIGIQTIPANE